jgi:hypothetical protein
MQPISVVALFCEDIRDEKSGMQTLIGIFPDNADVPAFPCTFPKLGLYLRIHIDPAFDPYSFSLVLRMPSGQEQVVAELGRELIDKGRREAEDSQSPLIGFISRTIVRDFTIPGPGRISAIVKVGEQELLAGALNVQEIPQGKRVT